MKEPSDKRKRTLALHSGQIRIQHERECLLPRVYPMTLPSRRVWDQLVRAADSTSNNLIEADGASSPADFLNKMGIALREAKESRVALRKMGIALREAKESRVDCSRFASVILMVPGNCGTAA